MNDKVKNPIFPESHISFNRVEKFQKLCDRILKSSNVDVCYYFRLYSDGSYFDLSTDMTLGEYVLSQTGGVYLLDFRILDIVFNDDRFPKISPNKKGIFSSDIEIGGYWDDLFKKFGFHGSFNIIEKHNDYYELFGFITSIDKVFYSFYYSQANKIEGFIEYCKKEGRELFRDAEKNKVFLFNDTSEYKKMLELGIVKAENEVDQRDEIDAIDLSSKRYLFFIAYDVAFYISHAELKVLRYLGRGHRVAEVAGLLFRAEATISTHLENMKNRIVDEFTKPRKSTKFKIEKCTHARLMELYRNSYLIYLDGVPPRDMKRRAPEDILKIRKVDSK